MSSSTTSGEKTQLQQLARHINQTSTQKFDACDDLDAPQNGLIQCKKLDMENYVDYRVSPDSRSKMVQHEKFTFVIRAVHPGGQIILKLFVIVVFKTVILHNAHLVTNLYLVHVQLVSLEHTALTIRV